MRDFAVNELQGKVLTLKLEGEVGHALTGNITLNLERGAQINSIGHQLDVLIEEAKEARKWLDNFPAQTGGY